MLLAGTSSVILLTRTGRITPTLQILRKSPMSVPASTILVVEDDAIVRMLIVDVLEELEYTVLEAEDGEEAQKCLKTNPRSLI